MNPRSFVRPATAVALLALALPAFAHDPGLHEPEEAKAKPTTCEQLADRDHYSNDLSDPDIKALKDQCDAARKPADKPAST